MLMFILTISYLTMSSLPWFMDLRFQVPMQHYSLQHWILLSSPDTSTTESHFCFRPAAFFFLELLVVVLHSSPLDTFQPGRLSVWCHIFFSFMQFMRFSWQLYWGGLPFPPPVVFLNYTLVKTNFFNEK